jgi:hypothetical protein
MEFIENSYKRLVDHCISNGLSANKADFTLVNSLSTVLDDKKINIFLLGVLLNREKTPKNKVQKIGREYELGHNYYEIFFALYVRDLDRYAMLLRILSDFEEDEDKNRYRLLNSSKELKDSMIVENFLSIKDSSKQQIATNSIFIRVETSVDTLQVMPQTIPVREIDIKTKRK